jgi:hypothetical protein
MKNIWKWVLGIILIMVVAAGLLGLGFVWRTRIVRADSPGGAPVPQMQRGPMRGGFRGEHREPMMGMRGFGYGPGRFGGGMFFGMFGRLIPLALGLLLLYGAYRLGKNRSVPVAVAAAPAPPATLSTTHPCPNCGSTVQNDWKHCPNCGEKQGSSDQPSQTI